MPFYLRDNKLLINTNPRCPRKLIINSRGFLFLETKEIPTCI